jgi:hypothetical protein
MENRDLIIYCDRASHSARELANRIECRRWYEESTPGRKTAPVVPVVINWGASNPPLWIQRQHWPWPNAVNFHILNDVRAVTTAINKFSTFELLVNHQIPTLNYRVPARNGEFVSDIDAWLAEDEKIIARDTVTGSGGRGLRVVTRREDIRRPQLITRYYPKTHEFRVHVFEGQVIDFTQKRLRPELVGQAERLVRSHENGWIHAHTLDEFVGRQRDSIDRACVAAVAALGLRFGAVDILARFSTKRNRPLKDFKVCEINTAPGLENSQTIEAYARAIDTHYHSIKGRHTSTFR